MNLDYLADGSLDCPLVRLYDFPAAEADALRVAVAGLVAGTSERVQVHRLPFVQPLGECELTLIACGQGSDVNQLGGSARLEWRLRPETWDNVATLIEPFAAGAAGFQWLNQGRGEVRILLSTGASW